MTHVKIEWDGQINHKVKQGVKESLYKAAIDVQKNLINSVNNLSPSAPGQPPGVVTGTLKRSIQIYLGKIESLKVGIGTRLKYAYFLEFGTKNMSPRPWFRYTFKQSKQQILKRLQRGFKGITKQ